MERPRIFRFLRIAATVLSLTACVLLIALWVRSYWWTEVIAVPLSSNWSIAAGSFPGMCGIGFPDSNLGWEYTSEASEEWWPNRTYLYSSQLRGAFIVESRSVLIPYWAAISITLCLTMVPWMPWSKRFRLRTLLIATTLVAVVLGLVVAFN